MLSKGTVFLLFLTLCFANKENKEELPPQPQCRDGTGSEVDWWVLIKEAGSLRYIYWDSLLAQKADQAGSPQSVIPLSKDKLLTDVNSSPFLRTVYDSHSHKDGKKRKKNDTRMIMAWNDQPPHGKDRREEKHEKKKKKKDDDDEDDSDSYVGNSAEIKRAKSRNALFEEMGEKEEGGGKDVYGHGVTEASAHSKGLMSIGVDVAKEEIRFYVISHSFPQTPNAPWNAGKEAKKRGVHRDRLPPAESFFPKNVTRPQSKGQHALCVSFRGPAPLKHGVLKQVEGEEGLGALYRILRGMATMAPAIVMFNYVPWLEQHRPYHRLFDIRSEWSKEPLNLSEKLVNNNLARVQKGQTAVESGHVFPIWPSYQRVVFEAVLKKDGTVGELKMKGRLAKTALSLRSSSQAFAAGCRSWELADPEKRDKACYYSAIVRSTANQYAASFAVDWKNGLVTIDLDDMLGARLVPAVDLALALAADEKGKIKAGEEQAMKHVSLAVVTQSWMDHGTQAPHVRNLVNTPKLRVRAWFHNALGIRLPSNDPKEEVGKLQRSFGLDHSKWIVAYFYGQTGNMLPFAGFSDGNRNAKTTALHGRRHGRGLSIWFTDCVPLVNFLLQLQPIVEDTASFTEFPIEELAKIHKRNNAETRSQTTMTVEQFSDDGTAFTAFYMNDGKKSFLYTYRTPYITIPKSLCDDYLRALNKGTPVKREQSRFLLGSPGSLPASLVPAFTPSKMRALLPPRKALSKDNPEFIAAKRSLLPNFNQIAVQTP